MKHHDQPFYRRIIADAWRIAWQHKHLWVFGFFATMIGFGGVTDPVFSASDRIFSMLPGLMNDAYPLQGIPGLTTFRAVMQTSPFPALTFILFLTGMAFFATIFAWMIFVSVGALVGSVRKIERGGDPHFSDEVKLGTERFWPVLGTNLFIEMFVFVLFMLTASTLRQLMRDAGLLHGLFYVGTFIVFTMLSAGASIVAVYATCEAVSKGRKMREAISSGVRQLVDHWLVAVELAIGLFVAGLLIGLASVLVTMVLSVPFIFMMIVAIAIKVPVASTIVVMTAAALMIAMIVLVGSFITVFQTAAWCLLWSEISHSKPAPPKLIRLARKHFPFLA